MIGGASVEDTLELWASSLRDVKGRIRPLFTQAKNEAQDRKELIRWSVQEIRRLALKFAQRQLPVARILKWSTFRRAHQAVARHAHLKKLQL